LEAFVDRRLREEGRPYLEAFEARRELLSALLGESDDLRDLSHVVAQPGYRAALRYLAGPPVSEDDLETISRADRFAHLSSADRLKQIFVQILDPLRFPWVREGRGPTAQERETSLKWTAGLWAVELVRTGRRGGESAEQEDAVAAVVESAGFVLQRIRGRVDRLDGIEVGHYTREINLGGLKCDVSVRLRDRRLLALECKVSNSELNSVKRLVREAGGKARQWQTLFGVQVVSGSVLRGVFRPVNVLSAQEDYGLAIFWEHDLQPLREFLASAE